MQIRKLKEQDISDVLDVINGAFADYLYHARHAHSRWQNSGKVSMTHFLI
ncbi:MAG: hypothetical protein WC623_08710 [Pedobacter sp.]